MGKMRNKEKVFFRTTLYLDYELYRQLKQFASKQERTLTELVNTAIEEYLKAQGGMVKDEQNEQKE